MRGKVRVLQLLRGLSAEHQISGGERYGIELALRLPQGQFQPLVCGLWQFGTPAEKEWREKLRSRCIRSHLIQPYPERGVRLQDVLSLSNRLAGYLKEQRIEIVHTHSMTSELVATIAKALGWRGALVRAVHNYDYALMLGKWRGVAASLANQLIYPLTFTLETGVSQAYADALNRRFLPRILGKNALWLPNAIDGKRFSSPAPGYIQRELGLPPDTTVVGLVGKLTWQKGVDVFLRAAALACRTHPGVHFAIIGDGDLDAAMRDLAKQLEIEGRVHFLGSRTDIEPLLSSLNVLTSASRWEGLPTVVIEAMAAGVPVAATDIRGTRELVENERNGILVPPESPTALASAISELVESEHLRKNLAANARMTAYCFDYEQLMPQLCRLYMQIAASA